MACMELIMAAINLMDDVGASLLYNICHMFEHSLQQINVDEATKMIVVPSFTTTKMPNRICIIKFLYDLKARRAIGNL